MNSIKVILLIFILTSCNQKEEVPKLFNQLDSWVLTVNWNENSGHSVSLPTDKGLIFVSTKTLEHKGNLFKTTKPVLEKGTFMVWPSLKKVRGLEQLKAEVTRSYKEDKLTKNWTE